MMMMTYSTASLINALEIEETRLVPDENICLELSNKPGLLWTNPSAPLSTSGSRHDPDLDVDVFLAIKGTMPISL